MAQEWVRVREERGKDLIFVASEKKFLDLKRRTRGKGSKVRQEEDSKRVIKSVLRAAERTKENCRVLTC